MSFSQAPRQDALGFLRPSSYTSVGSFVRMLFGLASLAALGSLISAIIFGDALVTGKQYQGANGVIDNQQAVLISASVFGFAILLAGPLGVTLENIITRPRTLFV